MKTLHITGKNENLNTTRDSIRVGIILTGIVTAIICLMALLYETKSVENETGTSRFIKISKIVKNDFLAEIVSKAVVSAIWPF